MEEESASELGADRRGPVSHVEGSRLVLGSGDSLGESQESRGLSCPASGQAGLPALTLVGWTLVALVMPVLPIFGASGKRPIHGYFPGLPTGPAGSLSTTPHLLLSPSRCSESGHQDSGVLGTQGWEDCHLARGVHSDAAVRKEWMLGQEGGRGPGQKRAPVSTTG